MVYAPYNEKKYKKMFDSMYGSGTFDAGLSQAREIGATTAQAKFAEDLYMQRLKDAQDAALAASEAAEAEALYQDESGMSVDDLLGQFQKEKEESSKTGITKYYENQTKELNKNQSKAQKPLEETNPWLIPSIRDNKNLTPYDRMKLLGG